MKTTQKRQRKLPAPQNAVVISDTHCGCQFGLFPNGLVTLDGGVVVRPSRMQKTTTAYWEMFFHEWVPMATKGEPWDLVFNGDGIDGVHHNSTTQITHNLADQARIAEAVFAPVVAQCRNSGGRLYWVRGTEAHVGKSGAEEERLARSLGAEPDEQGHHARWDLWKIVGNALVHFTHHIGTTGSAAYESTAVWKEIVEAFVEAGRWRNRPPDIIVRSHRHRYFLREGASDAGDAVAVVTPAWQLMTPFCYRIPGARQSQPQIGGILIRQGDAEFFVRKKVWHMVRSKTVR